MKYTYELGEDVKVLHDDMLVNGILINELNVNGIHLKNLRMICMNHI